MTLEDWKVSTKSKIEGSWNLHTLLPKRMDFFVLLSSVCGVIGKETTANYSAGNSYMDALARYRIAIGEKAASLDLGIMEEEGILAEDAELMARVKASGAIIPMVPQELHALLDHFCNPALELLSPVECQAVIGIDTPANLHSRSIEPSSWIHRPIFSHLFQMDRRGAEATNSDRTVDFMAAFSTARSIAEAGDIVADALLGKLASSISIPKEDMDSDKPVHHYGVDSLVAIELRNWFARKLNADVAVFDILGDSSLTDLGRLAAMRSSFRRVPWNEEQIN